MFECDNLLITPEKIVTVLSGIATPTIALVVAIITWQNWETYKGALREKLFVRRFAIFRETQKFLSQIAAELTFSNSDFWEFTDACQRSRFLFGKDIQTYLLSIRKRALDLQLHNTYIENPSVDFDHSEQVRGRYEAGTWLNGQLDVIFDRFEPFLGFEKTR